MRSWLLLVAPISFAIGICAFRGFASQPGPVNAPITVAPQPSMTMPIKKLTLHTNGLAVVRREAEVTGPVTIDLPVPIHDVNDWLKSLDIEDPTGRAETVVFDSPDPVERSLQSFAFDLTGNPAFGELLNQGRGERVEITLGDGNALTRNVGSLLGLEERVEQLGTQLVATDYINLRLDEGLRSWPLRQIRGVKFVNPRLDSDLQRSLALVAGTKDDSRKLVRVTIPAGPKRKISMTYVAEAPVWKVSYRLNSTPAETQLRSWALVENTTDDDWNDVQLTLAGGRPVSFQMDLYQPLFVPRPVVDLPKMAALRPPHYAGPNNQSNLGIQGGALGFAGGTQQNNLGIGGGGFGMLGGGQGKRYLQANTLERGDDDVSPMGSSYGRGNRYQQPRRRGLIAAQERASIEEYQQRQKQVVAESAGPADALPPATDDPPREPARYVIDPPVTIPRFKSALVPVFSKHVTATEVAIYSPEVHATRPLTAMRVKNETNQTLVAGPMTVNDASGFAGDARITDWPVNEERFVGFALNSDLLVTRKENNLPDELVAARIKQGVIVENRRLRQVHEFTVVNRSNNPRVLWLELQIGPEWKLIEPDKADERTKGRSRFRVDIPANTRIVRAIQLEQMASVENPLDNIKDDSLRRLIQNPVVKENVREALNAYRAQQSVLEAASVDIREAGKLLEAANSEQNRLRTNLERTPATSELSKRYLEKLGHQESEIEKLQLQLQTRHTEFKTTLESLKSKSSTLNVE